MNIRTNWQIITGILVGCLLAANLALAGRPASRAEIQVEGLSCPFCVAGLEKHLKKLPGVEKVDVSLKTGEAVVSFRPGQTVSERTLRQAVRKAGFTAGKIRFVQKVAPPTAHPSIRGG